MKTEDQIFNSPFKLTSIQEVVLGTLLPLPHFGDLLGPSWPLNEIREASVKLANQQLPLRGLLAIQNGHSVIHSMILLS